MAEELQNSPDKSTAAPVTQIPVRASKASIIFLLSARSARMPPRGDNRIAGTVATDRIPANTAAEPVSSNTYMDSANRNM